MRSSAHHKETLWVQCLACCFGIPQLFFQSLHLARTMSSPHNNTASACRGLTTIVLQLFKQWRNLSFMPGCGLKLSLAFNLSMECNFHSLACLSGSDSAASVSSWAGCALADGLPASACSACSACLLFQFEKFKGLGLAQVRELY